MFVRDCSNAPYEVIDFSDFFWKKKNPKLIPPLCSQWGPEINHHVRCQYKIRFSHVMLPQSFFSFQTLWGSFQSKKRDRSRAKWKNTLSFLSFLLLLSKNDDFYHEDRFVFPSRFTERSVKRVSIYWYLFFSHFVILFFTHSRLISRECVTFYFLSLLPRRRIREKNKERERARQPEKGQK